MPDRHLVFDAPQWKRAVSAIGLVAATSLLAGCTGSGSASTAGSDQSVTDEATVVRVIDGDTFVASIDGSEETVRLLNVDTPETKKPNVAVQCLGPEASAYLEQRLPAGSSVQLEYDVERLDRYKRTLAGVFQGDDFINADVARTGHGVAVVFEPNHRFYGEIAEAQDEAVKKQAGLFSPVIDCTTPGQVESAVEGLEGLASGAPGSVEEASGLLATTTAAIAGGKAADLLLRPTRKSGQTVRAVVGASVAGRLMPKLNAAIKKGTKQKVALKKQREALVVNDRKIAARAKAKAEAAKRKDAERKASAKRLAAAEVARKRAALDVARKQAAQEAAREAARASAARESAARKQAEQVNRQKAQSKQVPRKAGNPYPGYNGPRCYAPGGRSWKPCP